VTRALARWWVAALVAVTVTIGAAGPLAAPAAAETGGKDNTAVAVNTKDDSSIFRFAFNITRVTGEVVDAQNAAVAYASCTECRTVAIAIQIVLVEGSPDTFVPENVAIAVNESCSHCETMAFAYQFVFQSSGRLELTPEGRRRVARIVHDIRKLQKSGLSAADLAAQIDAKVKELYDVLSTELHEVPPDQGQQGPPGSTSTTAAAGATTTSVGGTTSTSRAATTTTSGSSSSSSTPTTSSSSSSSAPTSSPSTSVP
jgi:putative peptide zinc metalloprotease protein